MHSVETPFLVLFAVFPNANFGQHIFKLFQNRGNFGSDGQLYASVKCFHNCHLIVLIPDLSCTANAKYWSFKLSQWSGNLNFLPYLFFVRTFSPFTGDSSFDFLEIFSFTFSITRNLSVADSLFGETVPQLCCPGDKSKVTKLVAI